MINHPPQGLNQPPQSTGEPGGPLYQAIASDNGHGVSQKGFFRSLFDFGFNSFVTPKVIKVLYVLVMVVAGLGALGLLIAAFEVSPIVGILSLVIGCPIYLFLTVAFYRVVLEFFMVVFRMAEDMRAIRDRGGVGMR